jgi:hypothetical protein
MEGLPKRVIVVAVDDLADESPASEQVLDYAAENIYRAGMLLPEGLAVCPARAIGFFTSSRPAVCAHR